MALTVPLLQSSAKRRIGLVYEAPFLSGTESRNARFGTFRRCRLVLPTGRWTLVDSLETTELAESHAMAWTDAKGLNHALHRIDSRESADE